MRERPRPHRRGGPCTERALASVQALRGESCKTTCAMHRDRTKSSLGRGSPVSRTSTPPHGGEPSGTRSTLLAPYAEAREGLHRAHQLEPIYVDALGEARAPEHHFRA